jgi:proton-coupled amino acid transporter
MTQPVKITTNKERRASIAKLTRSPLSHSPSSRLPSTNNSFKANGVFSRSVKEDEHPMLSSSSSSNANGIDESDEVQGEANYARGIHDPKLIQTVSKHLPEDGNLKSEGGDITRDLFKLTQEIDPPRLTRSLSSSEIMGRRGSSASSVNVPGGFRREFISQQLNKRAHQTVKPNFVTRNFVEFLSIYGHFAGEELEDDDAIVCHYRLPSPYKVTDEESALLPDETINRNGTATERKAYFLLLKAFVGTGVLFLPKAFSNGGLLFSVGLLMFFGILSYWCYLVLVYSKNATGVSSFAEIGNQLFGPWFQKLILFSIVISQVGFVAAYMVFTGENLRAFFISTTGMDPSHVSMVAIIALQAVILIPLSFIRDITKLSLLAAISNLFILGGLITILYYVIYELLVINKASLGPNIEFMFNKSDFSLFIGVAIFAFEGIGLIIPIQESMIHPEKFPKVLGQVVLTISIVFISMGTIGYLTFGENIKTVIILNLPQHSPVINVIQLFYSIAILLSTPLQLFPAIRLVESKIFFKKTGKTSPRIKWSKNLFRTIAVFLISVLACYGGQNLDRFVSFIGCFACIPLVYVYPPILHIKSCCNLDHVTDVKEISRRKWLTNIDYLLVIVGMVGMAYTTYQILNG